MMKTVQKTPCFYKTESAQNARKSIRLQHSTSSQTVGTKLALFNTFDLSVKIAEVKTPGAETKPKNLRATQKVPCWALRANFVEERTNNCCLIIVTQL